MPLVTETTSTARSRSGRHLRLVAPGVPLEAAASGHIGARRVLNLVVALIGLIVTFPLWVLIALAIKLTSRGPIFYTQVRVGLDTRATGLGANDPRRRVDLGGRPFTIYKFRTMTVDAEIGSGAVWAQKNDARVTSIGRWLRQYRLDELPQLINVIKGEMNVVGPRPERPAIFADLREEIPGYQRRQRTPPGITGHAQINLEYDSSVDDVRRKLAYDIEYIERANFWQDLWIMLKTVPVMLFRKGSR